LLRRRVERDAATAYLQSPTPLAMRALFLSYFQWRIGVGRAIGCARQIEQNTPTVRSAAALTSPAIRQAETRTRSALASTLREELITASRGADGTFPAASAARELMRDLKISQAAPGDLLRVGIIHQSEAQPLVWSIRPHAPGLPTGIVARKGLRDVMPGCTVFYVTDGRGQRARAVHMVSPGAAKRRRARPKIPGTIGPRLYSGPIRRIVSGRGGPGTGKR
jgi:hypothetical protein